MKTILLVDNCNQYNAMLEVINAFDINAHQSMFTNMLYIIAEGH